MANPDKPDPVIEKQTQEIAKLVSQLDMFDQRLDNIDSIVSAVVERVMKQPVTLNITCSQCGHQMEIAILGATKPTK